ncbi:hypothetical protein DS745_19060 [Anaerobacillus alkaliphilus]|uniref:Uncharacterized protein n=1 Tax=Anaerobacillus alkaliphilus TaxID=1548597 RepID=A0A4Q0VPM2_9BACI|nr:hypothetical protein [Anaerobacillus alkaliphilus]RXI98426.1 hypothetical protein DS745_19060 [Anaerobacillus alkaliphilus]
MKKNMFLSMVLVFFSTLFLLTFLAGGLYLFDKLARPNAVSVEAETLHRQTLMHSTIDKLLRFRENDVAVFFSFKRT